MTHDTKEQIKNDFWEMMKQNQFVKSTNEITGKVEEYPPAILDMEAIVFIHGEFDKYAIDEWLHHQLQKAREEERALLRYAIEGVAKKHGGAVEVILQGVIGGIDRINQAEQDHDISNK